MAYEDEYSDKEQERVLEHVNTTDDQSSSGTTPPNPNELPTDFPPDEPLSYLGDLSGDSPLGNNVNGTSTPTDINVQQLFPELSTETTSTDTQEEVGGDLTSIVGKEQDPDQSTGRQPIVNGGGSGNGSMPTPDPSNNPDVKDVPVIDLTKQREEGLKEQQGGGKTKEAKPKAPPLPTPQERLNGPEFTGIKTEIGEKGDKKQETKSLEESGNEIIEGYNEPDKKKESIGNHQQVLKMEESADENNVGTFDVESFVSKLKAKIEAIAPKTEEEADEFTSSGKVEKVQEETTSTVNSEKQKTTGPIETTSQEIPDTSDIVSKEVENIPKPDIGEKTSIKAGKGLPKPHDSQTIKGGFEEQSSELDNPMLVGDTEITDDTLLQSNEPTFIKAKTDKDTAQQDSKDKSQQSEQHQRSTLSTAKGIGNKQGDTSMQDMHGERVDVLNTVYEQQKTASEGYTEEERVVADKINEIYQNTKTDVETRLTNLDTEVAARFEKGAKRAQQRFENYVDAELEAYKDKRYEGASGVFTWIGDAFTGLPDEVYVFFERGRNLYIDDMEVVIRDIAEYIVQELNAAKQRVQKGREEIKTYVESLPDNLRKVGDGAAKDIMSQFDELDQQVDSKQDSLINDLAQSYTTALESVDAKIEEMKAANRGLIDMALDGIKGVIEVINSIRETLMQIISTALKAIAAIIMDPIGFLGNLVDGIGAGFDNFIANIDQHLIAGFVGWLTGALSSVSIEMPDDVFSLQGIFSIVTQALGLNFGYVEEKATKALGPTAVGVIMQGFEIFQILRNEGLAGAWEFIQEQFADLQDTIMGAVQQMLITQVIEAGIKWLLGLLTPAGAFVKAAMMIIDIVEFFINQGSQILELVKAFVDSVAAIASGAVGQASKLIETALAKSIPVLIGFLASLLGIDGLADGVVGIFKRIRKRVDAAIDGLIERAKTWFGKNKKGKGKGKNDKDKKKDKDDGKKEDKRSDAQKKADFDKGMTQGAAIVNDKENTKEQIVTKVRNKESQLKLQELDAKLLKEKGDLQTWILTGELGKNKGQKKIEREKTKAETEDQVSDEDRKKHEKIAGEVTRILKEEKVKDGEDFGGFYLRISSLAKELEKRYQPQLREGIRISIDLINTVKNDEGDGDVDFKIRIAPNTVEVIESTNYDGTAKQNRVPRLEIEKGGETINAYDPAADRGRDIVGEITFGKGVVTFAVYPKLAQIGGVDVSDSNRMKGGVIFTALSAQMEKILNREKAEYLQVCSPKYEGEIEQMFSISIVQAVWGGDSTNLEDFNKNYAKMSKEEAAKNTFTGAMSRKFFGFENVYDFDVEPSFADWTPTNKFTKVHCKFRP